MRKTVAETEAELKETFSSMEAGLEYCLSYGESFFLSFLAKDRTAAMAIRRTISTQSVDALAGTFMLLADYARREAMTVDALKEASGTRVD